MKKIFSFKPKLIPTLFTIPALILLLGLSFWQFQRLQWKESLIAEIDHKIQIPMVLLPKNVDLHEMLYRKVKVKGEFLHKNEMYVYGGTTKPSNEHFYYILTPFLTEDGRLVIVNRGWVPEKLKHPDSRSNSLIQGQVEVIGAIMINEEKSAYIHDNQPERNLWFYINLEEISTFLSKPVEKFYILSQYEEGDFPKGRDIKPNLYNNHLGYALTWLFSALSLVVIYVLYHQKNEK